MLTGLDLCCAAASAAIVAMHCEVGEFSSCVCISAALALAPGSIRLVSGSRREVSWSPIKMLAWRYPDRPGVHMQRAFEFKRFRKLEEVCDRTDSRLDYFRHAGRDREADRAWKIAGDGKGTQVLEAARAARTCGYFTLATCRYRRTDGSVSVSHGKWLGNDLGADDVKPWFLRDSPGFS